MKTGRFGIAVASAAVGLMTLCAAKAEDTTQSPQYILAANGTAPATAETLKTRIDAINSSRPASGVDEVVKLSKAGVDNGVIETFIRNSRIPGPTSQELVYLHDQGVPESLVKALIEHGKELRQANVASNPAPAANNSGADNNAAPAPAAASGPVYNNYISPAPVTQPGSSYGGSSVLIIPSGQSLYSADFQSYYWGSPHPYWPYGYASSYYGAYYRPYGYASYGYCGPYRSYYNYGFRGYSTFGIHGGFNSGFHGGFRGGGLYYHARR